MANPFSGAPVLYYEPFTAPNGTALPFTWVMQSGLTPRDVQILNNRCEQPVGAAIAPYAYDSRLSIDTTQGFCISAYIAAQDNDSAALLGLWDPSQLKEAGNSGYMQVAGAVPNPTGLTLAWNRTSVFTNAYPFPVAIRVGIEVDPVAGVVNGWATPTPVTDLTGDWQVDNTNMVKVLTLPYVGLGGPHFPGIGLGGAGNSMGWVDDIVVSRPASPPGEACPSTFVNPVWPMPAEGEG